MLKSQKLPLSDFPSLVVALSFREWRMYAFGQEISSPHPFLFVIVLVQGLTFCIHILHIWLLF